MNNQFIFSVQVVCSSTLTWHSAILKRLAISSIKPFFNCKRDIAKIIDMSLVFHFSFWHAFLVWNVFETLNIGNKLFFIKFYCSLNFPVWDLIGWKWIKQKQSSIRVGVLKKRCSENMQKIYRRTPMPKCNFNKVALQLYWNHTSAWVFSCKFAAYFQNTFP